jgi:hypothetical protein
MSLEQEALEHGVRPPQPGTLAKYGLSADEWLAMLKENDWRCPICFKGVGVRWVTDHRHVPGWKAMAPEDRKRHVRGVLCSFCNHRRVHSTLNAEMAQRIADYFKRAEERMHGQ